MRVFTAIVMALQFWLAPAHAQPAKPTVHVVHVAQKPLETKKILAPRQIARRASRSLGFGEEQQRCLDMLWMKESHFNPKSRNKHSGAYGIAQFLPSTWDSYKVKKTSDPNKQIKYGLRYITKRYGTPCKAWWHSKRHGWY